MIQNLDTIKEYIKENDVYSFPKIEFVDNNKYLRIALPSCNVNWTFEVWKWIIAFKGKFEEVYPVHYSNHKNDKWAYIDVSHYTEYV